MSKKKNLNGICKEGKAWKGVKDLNRYNMGQEGLGIRNKIVRIPANKGTKAAISWPIRNQSFRVKSFHNVCLLSPSSFPLERATKNESFLGVYKNSSANLFEARQQMVKFVSIREQYVCH